MKVYVIRTEDADGVIQIDSVWSMLEAAEARVESIEASVRWKERWLTEVDVLEADLDAVTEIQEVFGRYV